MTNIFCALIFCVFFISCAQHLGDFEYLSVKGSEKIESNSMIFNKECNLLNQKSIYLCQMKALDSIYKVFKIRDNNFLYLRNIDTIYKIDKGYIQIIINNYKD